MKKNSNLLKLFAHPHRRYNPLKDEWVLVSPHRAKRPWQGQVEAIAKEKRPKYDPKCYLCPGNERAGGHRNPKYSNTFVFTNDFSAILPATDYPQELDINDQGVLIAKPVCGTCRVLCFSPRHDLTLADMSITAICKVIDLWINQTKDLEKDYVWVQVFENKGAIMGCSNPHPHGQVWASDTLPNELVREDNMQKRYYTEHKTPLLFDYARLEEKCKERVVVENDDWIVVVPFWALWPFETLLLPKKQVQSLPAINKKEQKSLAIILKQLLMAYDLLFNTSFPYSMGWHGRPAFKTNEITDMSYWQLHAHFYPPLLRSASVRKFMAGYELLAEAHRDASPEEAALRLREKIIDHAK